MNSVHAIAGKANALTRFMINRWELYLHVDIDRPEYDRVMKSLDTLRLYNVSLFADSYKTQERSI